MNILTIIGVVRALNLISKDYSIMYSKCKGFGLLLMYGFIIALLVIVNTVDPTLGITSAHYFYVLFSALIVNFADAYNIALISGLYSTTEKNSLLDVYDSISNVFVGAFIYF